MPQNFLGFESNHMKIKTCVKIGNTSNPGDNSYLASFVKVPLTTHFVKRELKTPAVQIFLCL